LKIVKNRIDTIKIKRVTIFFNGICELFFLVNSIKL
jgi:hypothetical protein